MFEKTSPEECQKVDPSDDLEDLAKTGFEMSDVIRFKSGVKCFEIGSIHPEERMGHGMAQTTNQIPLQSLPALQQINTSNQLGIVCGLTEGTIDPLLQIINKDIEQDWAQS
ncbi:hypothetical protein BTVI_87290 [Pitangus sulphuratus]|nr:hypothetical protein BTVI_87290 [Pitangus sulphuratus]